MADLSDSVNWSEVDASNNKASPNGWPEGMMPSGVNDSARSDKGALKRFWDRINPVEQIAPAGGIWTYTTSNPAYPTAYVDGEVYSFWPVLDGVGGDQFKVNALAAKPIWKRVNVGTGFAPVAVVDIVHRTAAMLVYDSTLNGGAGAFVLVNPFVPITGNGAGSVAIAGDLYLAGTRIFFNGNTNPATGPQITFDASGAVLRLGSTTGNFAWANSAGNTLMFLAAALGGALTVGGQVISSGSSCGLVFYERDDGTPSGLWQWYANANQAFLSGLGGNRITLSAAGATFLGDVTAGGSLRAATYLYLGNTAILFNGNTVLTQGPHLNVDNTNWTFRLGPGGGGYFFINSAGGILATIDAAGSFVSNGNIQASAVTGTYVHSTGNIQADGTFTGGSVLVTLDAGARDFNATRNIWATAGAVTASYLHSSAGIQADGTFTGGSVSVSGEIAAGANLRSAAGLFLGNPYILFNGNPTISQGPFLNVDNTNWTSRLGAGAGRWYFATSAGSIVASIDAVGNIFGGQLRGGNGASDAGVLRGMPTADPTPHTIAFGWDGINSVFYRTIDNTRTDTLIWSDTIRAQLLAADGGTPSGWRLGVFSGGTVFNIYVSFTASDIRLKRGVGDSKVDALAAICAVPVRRFEWRKEVQATFGVPQKPVEIGLVAQDLLPHMPDCVGISEGREKPYPADTHTIMHDRIDAYVIRAIQQLEARIAQLEAR